jgi:hypothetical protein
MEEIGCAATESDSFLIFVTCFKSTPYRMSFLRANYKRRIRNAPLVFPDTFAIIAISSGAK